MLIRATSEPDSGTSSLRDADSVRIARQARRKAFLARQGVRNGEGSRRSAGGRAATCQRSKSRNAGSSLGEHNGDDAFLQKSQKDTSAVPSVPVSSPIKRGLKYLLDNFIPNLLSPNRRSNGQSGNRQRVFSQLLVEQRKLAFHEILSDESMSEDTAEFSTNRDASSSSSNSGDFSSSPISCGPVSATRTPSADLSIHELVDGVCSSESQTESIPHWCATVSKKMQPTLEEEFIMEYESEEQEARRAEEHEKQKHRWAELKVEEEEAREELERMEDLDAFPHMPASQPRSSSSNERFHPYGRSVRRSPSKLRRFKSTGPAKYIDPIVQVLVDYEQEWERVKNYDIKSHTFATVPWPLLSPPQTPADVTPARVRDFMHFARCAPKPPTLSLLRHVAKVELVNWNPDKFAERVLAFVHDDAEAEVIRAAAVVVQKVLWEFLMASY